ncbi:hypothetical protein [Bradyrhizobium japonicum]|uniref:hypothetical protein n=1 Tax=Bradyrhizobium japonicum TaxID=375 RepID=UPI000B30E62A|nr:hypothetical protein [Bradyrhizobium japonicum]
MSPSVTGRLRSQQLLVLDIGMDFPLRIDAIPGRRTTMSLRFPEATTTTRSPYLDLQTG